MKWELRRLIEAFNKLTKEGWDMSKDMNWGFTFFAKDKEVLDKIYDELIEYDYKKKELLFRNDLNLWILYVTKIEVLRPDKLHKRNQSFEALASYYNAESYDGWDVEKVNS